MNKRLIGVCIVLLVVLSLFVAAQTTSPECGFWCKVKNFLFGEDRSAVVGEAGVARVDIQQFINGHKNVELHKTVSAGADYEVEYYVFDKSAPELVFQLNSGGLLTPAIQKYASDFSDDDLFATYNEDLNGWKMKSFLTEHDETQLNSFGVTDTIPPFTLSGPQLTHMADYLDWDQITALNNRGVVVKINKQGKEVKYYFNEQGDLLAEEEGKRYIIDSEAKVTEITVEGSSSTASSSDRSTAGTISIDSLDTVGNSPYVTDKYGNVYKIGEHGEYIEVTNAAELEIVYQNPDYEPSKEQARKKTELKETKERSATGSKTAGERLIPEIEGLDEKLKCYSTPGCDKEKITYLDAANQIQVLVQQAEAKSGQADEVLAAQRKVDEIEKKINNAPERSKLQPIDLPRELSVASNELATLESKYNLNADDAAVFKERARRLKEAYERYHAQSSWFEVVGSEEYQTLFKGNWVGGYFGQGLQRVAESLGSYQSLSNLLIPADATKSFMRLADTETLNQLSSWNPVGFDVCSTDDYQRSSQPGQNAAFIQTAGGAIQFVGAIHAEIGGTPNGQPAKFPILCEKNADQDYVCKGGSVCKDDGFCYKDENAKQPEQGYFYKITWGVTAPTDEKFTPYIDEDGKSVKFNLQLRDADGKFRWHFRRGEQRDSSVIELKNGEKDGGSIIKYSKKDPPFSKICIVFGTTIKDYFGDEVSEICADFVVSTRGTLEYTGSDKTPSIPSTSAEVSEDGDW